MHGNSPFWSRFTTAASQLSQTFVPAQVQATHSHFPSLCEYLVNSSRIETYRASSLLVVSAPLFFSYVDNGTPQSSVFLRSHLVLSLKPQTHELQKLHKRLLRQSVGAVKKLNKVLWSLSRRSDLCQNHLPAVGTFCNSLRKDRRTQPVPVH